MHQVRSTLPSAASRSRLVSGNCKEGLFPVSTQWSAHFSYPPRPSLALDTSVPFLFCSGIDSRTGKLAHCRSYSERPFKWQLPPISAALETLLFPFLFSSLPTKALHSLHSGFVRCLPSTLSTPLKLSCCGTRLSSPSSLPWPTSSPTTNTESHRPVPTQQHPPFPFLFLFFSFLQVA